MGEPERLARFSNAARPVDLDVADVVVLEIVVGFGGDAATNVDLGDNLDLPTPS